MFLQSKAKSSVALSDFVNSVSKNIKAKNGHNLNQSLTVNCPLGKSDLMSITPDMLQSIATTKLAGLDFISDFLLFLRSQQVAQNDVGALEMLSSCLRKLVVSYASEEGDWLFPVFSHVAVLARRLANKLDSSNGSSKWRKKMVEIFRELFPILHKERERLSGTCWLICQLLYLYVALDQAKLCAHILAALSQSLVKEGGFDPESVHKSVAVTLYYYWGRFLVMDGKIAEARAKLQWAFINCVKHARNRKRIAEYLIPCMIATGSAPKDSFIRDCGLDYFVELTAAIKKGDVAEYNKLMDDHMILLAQSGTLFLMEKCKIICYRNLAKRVSSVLRHAGSDSCKLDLLGFEVAWDIMESSSRNEVICALADLIYSGAIKGYLAPDHNKLVLSKAAPFPPIRDVLG
jgi:hypothetical protein